MKLRAMIMGAATAALVAIPSLAMAAWGQATGDVNMRTGPSTSYHKIVTVPEGARVWVGGNVNGWYQVRYNGRTGYVSGSYIATNNGGYTNYPPRMGGPTFHRPAPPRYGFWHKPRWDDRYEAWYDGRRWYRNGIWYNDPSGFSFGFRFGG